MSEHLLKPSDYHLQKVCQPKVLGKACKYIILLPVSEIYVCGKFFNVPDPFKQHMLPREKQNCEGETILEAVQKYLTEAIGKPLKIKENSIQVNSVLQDFRIDDQGRILGIYYKKGEEVRSFEQQFSSMQLTHGKHSVKLITDAENSVKIAYAV